MTRLRYAVAVAAVAALAVLFVTNRRYVYSESLGDLPALTAAHIVDPRHAGATFRLEGRVTSVRTTRQGIVIIELHDPLEEIRVDAPVFPLGERFAGQLVFDPITVLPAVDEYGDGDGEEYLRVMIVFDGEQDALDARWTSGLIRRIRPKLFDAGVMAFPSLSFVEKSEWPRLEQSLKRASA